MNRNKKLNFSMQKLNPKPEKLSLSETIAGFFFGRFRKNSLKKNSPISKNSLIFAETHGKKDPETEISANFSYLTIIPAIINLRKNGFLLVLLTITTWYLKNSMMKKKLTSFCWKTHWKSQKLSFWLLLVASRSQKNAQKKAWYSILYAHW